MHECIRVNGMHLWQVARDLRPRHVMMSDEGDLFLSHFGVMRTLTGVEKTEDDMVSFSSSSSSELICLIQYFSAPEVFLK